MSVHYISAAYRAKVGNAITKAVLVKLADNCNDKGVCWPSLNTIARETELNRSTVIRHIARLKELGVLIVNHRMDDDGASASNRYLLSLTALRKLEMAPLRDAADLLLDSAPPSGPQPPPLVADSHHPSRTQPPPLVAHSHPGSGPQPPKPSMNRHLEPSKEPTPPSPPNQTPNHPTSPVGEIVLFPANGKATDPAVFFTAWNDHCGVLPKCRRNAEAAKLIKRELKTRSPAELVAAISSAAKVVAKDAFWIERGYGLVNLLRHLDSKVEQYQHRGDLSNADAKTLRRAQELWQMDLGGSHGAS